MNISKFNQAMAQDRKLTKLKNIGKKIAGRLNDVGIFTEKDLRSVGAVQAHTMIKAKYPNETLPVCYYLYSFEGALSGKHWDAIDEDRKRALKEKSANKSVVISQGWWKM